MKFSAKKAVSNVNNFLWKPFYPSRKKLWRTTAIWLMAALGGASLPITWALVLWAHTKPWNRASNWIARISWDLFSLFTGKKDNQTREKKPRRNWYKKGDLQKRRNKPKATVENSNETNSSDSNETPTSEPEQEPNNKWTETNNDQKRTEREEKILQELADINQSIDGIKQNATEKPEKTQSEEHIESQRAEMKKKLVKTLNTQTPTKTITTTSTDNNQQQPNGWTNTNEQKTNQVNPKSFAQRAKNLWNKVKNRFNSKINNQKWQDQTQEWSSNDNTLDNLSQWLTESGYDSSLQDQMKLLENLDQNEQYLDSDVLESLDQEIADLQQTIEEDKTSTDAQKQKATLLVYIMKVWKHIAHIEKNFVQKRDKTDLNSLKLIYENIVKIKKVPSLLTAQKEVLQNIIEKIEVLINSDTNNDNEWNETNTSETTTEESENNDHETADATNLPSNEEKREQEAEENTEIVETQPTNEVNTEEKVENEEKNTETIETPKRIIYAQPTMIRGAMFKKLSDTGENTREDWPYIYELEIDESGKNATFKVVEHLKQLAILKMDYYMDGFVEYEGAYSKNRITKSTFTDVEKGTAVRDEKENWRKIIKTAKINFE